MCSVFKHSSTFPVVCCHCPSYFGTCCRHQIQNEWIFAKKLNILNLSLKVFANHCILFSFTFYTMSQLHWNWDLYIFCLCLKEDDRLTPKTWVHLYTHTEQVCQRLICEVLACGDHELSADIHCTVHHPASEAAALCPVWPLTFPLGRENPKQGVGQVFMSQSSLIRC